MALDFSVLQTGSPVNAFFKGQEDVAQNKLAQQKMVQDEEINALRRKESELNMQRTLGLMQQDEESKLSAKRTQKIAAFRDRMLRAPTPDVARQIVNMQYQDPDVSPILSQTSSLEQALAEVPNDPNEFRTYLNQEAMGMSEWIKSQAKTNEPKVVGNAVYIPSENRFIAAPSQKQQPPVVQEFLFAQTPEGGNYRGSYQQFLADKSAAGRVPSRVGGNGGSNGPAAAPAVKPMTELQQRKADKERVGELQGVKAAKSTADELEKLTDELAGNPAKNKPPHPGYEKIIGIQANIPSLPGGDAKRAEQKLETFKGKIATFGRQLATQYGKLGNMAVQEWKIVADSIQNINPVAGNLDEQMRDVVRLARDFEKSMEEKYDALYGNDSQQPATPAQPATKSSRTVTKTGTLNGKRVVQYSDGSVEYAD